MLTCPLCKAKHPIPSQGFPINRAVLDIIEELNNDCRPIVLKCKEHDNKVCVLICVECEIGLCVQCIKQGAHKSHQLEEPEEAKSVLSDKFDSIVEQQKSKLEAFKKQIDKASDNMTEIENAQTNIKDISERIVGLVTEWRDSQLKVAY